MYILIYFTDERGDIDSDMHLVPADRYSFKWWYGAIRAMRRNASQTLVITKSKG